MKNASEAIVLEDLAEVTETLTELSSTELSLVRGGKGPFDTGTITFVDNQCQDDY